MARCSDHRGQGPRPGPVPRAPRGLLHPRAVVEGEEAENDSGGASIAPRARPRMRIAALPSHRIDPAGRAAVRPPHTRAVASPPLPCPHCTDPLMPQRRARPARPLVGLTSSSAAPSAAAVEVAAAAAADELVGPKRRRATTLTRLLPTYAGVNATREGEAAAAAESPAAAAVVTADGRPPPQPSPPLLPPTPQPPSPPLPTLPSVGACRRASWARTEWVLSWKVLTYVMKCGRK